MRVTWSAVAVAGVYPGVMRALWRGSVTFGLVSIPVRLFGAVEERDVGFHLVHRDDGGRIRRRQVCSACGEEVGPEAVVKGHELPDGRLVLLEEEDFGSLPLSGGHTMEVVEFVSADEVDPMYLHKTYYLEPDRTAVSSYILLRDALDRAWRWAVVKFTMRRRETLAVVRARGGVLVVHTLLRPDQIREPEFEFLQAGAQSRPQEMRMATSLVNSMAGTFDPAGFTDEYRGALARLIQAKSEGARIPAARAPEETGGMDLSTALRRSLEEVRAAKEDPSR